jgi:hypothetical protein
MNIKYNPKQYIETFIKKYDWLVIVALYDYDKIQKLPTWKKLDKITLMIVHRLYSTLSITAKNIMWEQFEKVGKFNKDIETIFKNLYNEIMNNTKVNNKKLYCTIIMDEAKQTKKNLTLIGSCLSRESILRSSLQQSKKELIELKQQSKKELFELKQQNEKELFELKQQNEKLQTQLSIERTKHLKIDLKAVEKSERMWTRVALMRKRKRPQYENDQ